MSEPRVIVALDFSDADAALTLAARLPPERCRLKVGKELFTAAGPELVRRLAGDGYGVFLDLKFHDIPNTVAGACRAAARLGAWMVDVHALGGETMVRAAREALHEAASGMPPLLVAVTVLTSLDEQDLAGVGLAGSPASNVQRLAALAARAGADGVVCSPREAAALRAERGGSFLLVTPGVRPAGGAAGDQKRIMTPAEALLAGASHLVVGRPITAAPDPLAALAAIEAELEPRPTETLGG